MIRETAARRPGPRRLPPGPPSPLARALGPPPGDRTPASVVGLEQEYSLVTAGGQPLDFRTVIHQLDVPGRRLDPGDLNAYRCRSGLAITCDAEDAEVVSPPVAVRPGFAAEIEAWAAHGRSELLRLLPAGIAVTPFSTHLSASMPDDLVDAVCDLFARTFAPALTLLLGGADSHGVYVRPRPARLEACGEHALGARLGAAAALVAGGSRACAAALTAGGGHMPPLLAVNVRQARGRRGLFIGRSVAFGQDLFAAGPAVALPLLDGGTIPAAEHLVAAWESVRLALGGDAGPTDLRAGDTIVSGAALVEADGAGDIAPSPFGDVLDPRRRPGFEAVAEAATWDFTLFRLTSAARHAYACVPGAQLGKFLDRLDTGALDGVLTGFLDTPPAGQVLTAHHETVTPGLWDDAVIGPDLLPYEQSAAEATLEPSASMTYVRRGKGVVFVTPVAPLTSSPISAAGPPAPSAGAAPVAPEPTAPPTVPPVVPLVATSPVPLPAPPAPPPPAATEATAPPAPAEVGLAVDPPVRPIAPAPAVERHRRRGVVLAGALLVLLLAAGATALAGAFGGAKSAPVEIVTGLTSPTVTGPTSPAVIVAPSTTGTAAATTTTEGTTTTIPPTTVTTATPRPTTAVSVPATPVTTVPVETTQRTTTTTTTVPTTTTQLVVSVGTGALGCVFQPPTATVRQGSTVRFRNDTTDGITISFPTPGAATTINLDAGGTSGALPLATAGAFTVTCTPGAGAVVGRMTITATAA